MYFYVLGVIKCRWLGDELLKSYPEYEEFRTGLKYVVKETTFSIDKLEDNEELRSDVVRAMDSNNNRDEPMKKTMKPKKES